MAQKLSRVTRDIWALSLATFINRATGFLGLFAAVFFTEIRLEAQAVVIVGWVLFSVGECLFAPMSHTYVAELASEAAQSRSQSYLATAQSLGYALGPGIGSWMLLVLAAGAWGGLMLLTLLALGLVLLARAGEPRASGAERLGEKAKA